MTVQEMTPTQCWDLLQSQSEDGTLSCVLIDVRTRAEWTFVGMPLLEREMPQLIGAEWQSFPHMQVDPNFTQGLSEQLDMLNTDKKTPLCFLCRSGVRSLHAAQAMAMEGYETVINIIGGFEGDPDMQGQRGRVNGWKAEGLPWRQS